MEILKKHDLLLQGIKQTGSGEIKNTYCQHLLESRVQELLFMILPNGKSLLS
jgi:hypothetical protein